MGGVTGTFQASDTSGAQKQTCVPPVTMTMVADIPGDGPSLNGSTPSARNMHTPSRSASAGSTNDSYVTVSKYSFCVIVGLNVSDKIPSPTDALRDNYLSTMVIIMTLCIAGCFAAKLTKTECIGQVYDP